MSTTVDQRIVEMRFDNKHFEQNVSTTMSTLEKLKHSLNFTGASKGLDSVNSAAKGVDMSGLMNSVDTVRTKFSALEVMGVTALANITNSAVNAGKRIVSALTIDPIKTGFQEYETQINSTQTILSNTKGKGSTIDDVNKALAELNMYADKTIYNFTEMTRNIGTFTAAGVDLQTSVDSIQGIANLAAVSGSTSQQASTAMYQLSQALASGTVKLMDWNSVVNAGMGGEMFQNALKETSRLLGTGADAAIEAEGSFRESLKTGWLTAEVLTATLKSFTTSGANEKVAEFTGLSKEAVEAALRSAEAQYGEADAIKYASKALAEKSGKNADEIKATLEFAKDAEDAATKVKTFTQLWDVMKESAQSGWSQTWKIVVGDFEAAKSLLTPLADLVTGFIGNMSDARNNILQGVLDFASPWQSMLAKFNSSGIKNIANTIDDATDKLTNFQEVVNRVWKGEFGSSDTGRFDLLTQLGYDPRVVQDLVNKGVDYKITIDDVKESYNKFGIAMSDASGEISNMEDMLANLTDEQLKAAGLTTAEIKLYRDLAAESERTGVSIKELADEMSKTDGRTLLIESFKNAGAGLIGVFTAMKEAWRDIFPEPSIVRIYNLVKAINTFSEKLRLIDSETGKLTETANKFKSIFKGVFAVIDLVRQVLIGVFTAISPLFGCVGDLSGGLLTLAASWGDWLVKLNETVKESGVINGTFKGIATFVQNAINAIKGFISEIKQRFQTPGLELIHSLMDRISERFAGVSEASEDMRSVVIASIASMGEALVNCKFLQLLQSLWDAVKAIGSGIASVLSKMISDLTNKIGNANFNGLFDFANSLSLAGIGLFIAKFVKGFSDIADTVSDFKEVLQKNVIGILDEVKGCFEAYQSQLKAGVLLKIAAAIAILAASILVISLIDSDKLSSSLGAVTVLFADLMGSMAVFGKITTSVRGVAKACVAMISISLAILILASALRKVGELDPGQMFTGLVGVIGLSAIMIATAKILSSGGKTIIKGALQMVIFAYAINTLADACTTLSSLSWDQLAKGLVGVGVLLGEVSLFLNTAKFGGKSITTAVGIVILASAIKVLASSCGVFGEMSWGSITKGLTSIGVLLLEVAAFTRLTGNAKHVIATGIALIAIGAAIKIFASSISDLSKMSWEELAKGLVGMAGALLTVTLAVNFMHKNMVGIGVGLIAVAAALAILSNVVVKMGGMEWSSIAKALVTLGGSLLILAAGLRLMTGTLSGSAAMIVAVAALTILVPVLLILGSMSWSSIAKGLVTIAGAFVILGVAGLVLGPLVPTILGLAGAFALVGVGVLAIGAGLMIAGAGLSAIAVGVGALATALVGGSTAIVAGLTVIVTGIASLIPMIITKLGEALIAFCMVIAQGAPAIGEAFKALILTLVDILVECVPAIADGALQLIVGVLGSLVEYTPMIVDLLFKFVISVLESLAENLPELIQKAVDVFMAYFIGIVDALKGIDTTALVQGIAGIGLMAGIMLALSAVASLVPGAMVGVLGVGAVIAEMALVLAAIGAIAQLPGLEWLIEEGGQFLEKVGVAIGSFIGGILGGIASGITSQLPDIGNDLSMFMDNLTPFIEGAKEIDPTVVDGVKSIADIILALTGANILDGLASWLTGSSSLEHFGEQLPMFATYINEFANNLGDFNDGKLAAITCATNAISSLASAASNLPNDGGWAGKIFGENSLAAFGEQLPDFATNLSKFATNLGTFGADKVASVECAVDAITRMAKISNSVDGQAEWAKTLFGDNSIATFAKDLPAIGTNLSKFASNLGTFTPENVASIDSAVTAINALATLADADLKNAKKHLSDFGDDICEFADDLSDFCSDMPSADSISSATGSLKNVLTVVKDISSTGTKSVSDFAKSLKDLAKNGVKDFVSAFTSGTTQSDVKKAGTGMMTKLIEGVKSKVEDLKETFENIASDGIKKIKTKTNYDKFYNAGAYLVKGFAKGIEDNKSKATAKAQAMVDAVESIVRNGLQINSPSKVFMEIGASIPEGFAKGIDNLSGDVTGSTTSMTEKAISSVRNALSRVSAAMSSDIDAQPTIRPVLDLSDVESGAGRINSLFTGNASVGVMANVGSISSMMNSSQNGTNDDVISAINSLRDSLGNSTGDTYQINGITYEDGSSVSEAIKTIVRAAKIERRV